MKKAIIILSLILLSVFSYSQPDLDSLWNVWNDESAADTTRLVALLEIANKGYLYSKPDSAYYYAQKAYDFASALDYKREMTNALSTQAASFYVRGDINNALNHYFKCLPIYEEMDDQNGTAKTLNNIGVMHSLLGNFAEAMDYHQRSLAIKEQIPDSIGMASSMNNIGLIFMNHGDYPRAIDYFEKSLKIREERLDKRGIASILNNIGLIYMRQKDYPNALDYFQRSLVICEEISDKMAVAGILSNIGLIYNRQENDSLALDYYGRSLEIMEEVSDKKGIANNFSNVGEIYLEQGEYSKAREYFQKSLDIFEEMSEKRGMASVLINMGIISNKERDPIKAINWCKKSLHISDEIKILEEQKNACQCLYDAYKAIGNDSKALEYYERIAIINDSLQAEETSKKLQQMEFEREIEADSLIREKEKLEVQIAHEAEVRKKTMVRNIFILSAAILLIGALTLHRRIVFVRRAKEAIENEKARSDKLLLNILPEEIAEELKTKGRAEARKFEQVTILFTDFKEFTRISSNMSAEDLVGEVNSCFERFDAICERCGIEKIKTIGDSYMAAGGLPVPSDDSVKNTVLAGIEMARCMLNLKKTREAEDRISFEMRVGIHTGPVVAGIVGTTKFQYDVWGDTVNTASRMENTGEAGKVNISRSTYEIIKDDPSFKFESRGKVKTKGKGDIEMWFVELAT